MKAPKSRLQAPEKLQISSSNRSAAGWRYPSRDVGALVLSDTVSGDQEPRHAFDPEERTAIFGEAIVRFSKQIPRDPTNNPLASQLVRCGTSIGANYCEANEGVSKKDFKHSIGRCVKEAKETKFFLRMIAAAEPALAGEGRKLYREARELHLIFAAIFRK